MHKRTHTRWILPGVILLLVFLGLIVGASWMAYNAGRVSGAQEAVAVMQSQEGEEGSEMPYYHGPMYFGRFKHGRGYFGRFGGGPPTFFPFFIGGILCKLFFLGLLTLLLIGLVKKLFWRPSFGWYGPPPGWEPPPGWKGPWHREEPQERSEE